MCSCWCQFSCRSWRQILYFSSTTFVCYLLLFCSGQLDVLQISGSHGIATYDELYSTYSTWSIFGWGYEYRSWRSSGVFSQFSITFTLLKDQITFHTADSQKLVKDCKQWEQFAWLCPNVTKSTRQHLWSSLIDMLCRLFNPWKSVKTIVCVVLWEVMCLGLFYTKLTGLNLTGR